MIVKWGLCTWIWGIAVSFLHASFHFLIHWLSAFSLFTVIPILILLEHCRSTSLFTFVVQRYVIVGCISFLSANKSPDVVMWLRLADLNPWCEPVLFLLCPLERGPVSLTLPLGLLVYLFSSLFILVAWILLISIFTYNVVCHTVCVAARGFLRMCWCRVKINLFSYVWSFIS